MTFVLWGLAAVVAGFLGVGNNFRVNIGDHRHVHGMKRERLQVGRKTVLRRLHHRAMKRCADGQHDGALRTPRLGQIGGALPIGRMQMGERMASPQRR